MLWISRISQGELLEYIMPGEIKKLNLLEVLQWKVQTQCYMLKRHPFTVFQARTRGGDIGEEVVWEFTADLFGLRELSRPASWTIKKKHHRGDASRGKKKKVGEEENSPSLCVRDLNTWIDSHNQAMSHSETNSLSYRHYLNYYFIENLQGKIARQQRGPVAIFWSSPSFAYPAAWHCLC